MNKTFQCAMLIALGLTFAGCNESGDAQSNDAVAPSADSDAHAHADGTTHDDHSDDHDHEHGHEHDHDEVALPSATIGDLTVELAQAHGAIKAGEESHLVVKLPYNDNGATTVRAWIGVEDRTLSFVGLGEYAPSHDDYDIHAMAPDPLPENMMWWIEIEKPDGPKVVGSTKPILE